jgi:hypothetical protein
MTPRGAFYKRFLDFIFLEANAETVPEFHVLSAAHATALTYKHIHQN